MGCATFVVHVAAWRGVEPWRKDPETTKQGQGNAEACGNETEDKVHAATLRVRTAVSDNDGANLCEVVLVIFDRTKDNCRDM